LASPIRSPYPHCPLSRVNANLLRGGVNVAAERTASKKTEGIEGTKGVEGIEGIKSQKGLEGREETNCGGTKLFEVTKCDG
jgi:hypothetical protein